MFRQYPCRFWRVESIVERLTEAGLGEFPVQDGVRMRAVGSGVVDGDVPVEEVAEEQCRGSVTCRS